MTHYEWGINVIHYLLNALDRMGIFGLFLVSAIEGSSIPFPSLIVVPTYGYLLHPSVPVLLGMAMGMSVIYTLFSYIPYWIGLKLQTKIKKRLQRKVQKWQRWFYKYGEGSILLLRLFGIGYISYISGILKVSPKKYGLLTFAGQYPWSFVLLLLGRMYTGNTYIISQLFQTYRVYIFLGLLMITIVYGGILFRRSKIGVE